MQIRDRNKEEMEEHTYIYVNKIDPGINIIQIIIFMSNTLCSYRAGMLAANQNQA